MLNPLNLPNYIVKDIKEDSDYYYFLAETAYLWKHCLHCESEKIIKSGQREQVIRDLNMHGKHVQINISTKRYHCNYCGRTFTEYLPDIDLKRRMTERMVAWIGKNSIIRQFANIAADVDVDEKTVKHVFEDYVYELSQRVTFKTPTVMGIDEIFVVGKFRCVITNIGEKTVVDMLTGKSIAAATKYLSSLSDKDRIECVTMDMWSPFKKAVKAVIPQAMIVVDRFHIASHLNQALDTIRKSCGVKLTGQQKIDLMQSRFVMLKREKRLDWLDELNRDTWLSKIPILNAAYKAKESFLSIYDEPTKTAALSRFEEWKAALPPELHPVFWPKVMMIERWRIEVFNYFERRVTNAFTESMNNLIRFQNRAGRGYSFKVLRAKILYLSCNRIPEIESKRRVVFRDIPAKPIGYSDLLSVYADTSAHDNLRMLNYGVPILRFLDFLDDWNNSMRKFEGVRSRLIATGRYL